MKCVEYEFVLSDGTKRYEMIDPDNDMSVMHQINLGMKLHGAIAARPVQASLFEEHGTIGSGRTSAIPSSEQQLGTLAG